MSEPAPGTNVHLIWTDILTDELLSYPQVKEKLRKFCPQINPRSFHVHLRSLVKRGYASKEQMDDGAVGFRRHEKPLQIDLLHIELPPKKKKRVYPTVPTNLKLLNYLKKHVGKEFAIKALNKSVKIKGTGAWDIMKAFQREGYVSSARVDKKLIYTVLPEIMRCAKPPSTTKYYPPTETKSKPKPKPKQELIHAEPEQTLLIPEPTVIQEQNTPNLLDMSVGQLGTYITTLRDENLKLKQTIETMVHLAIQAGVVDQE